MAVTLTQIATLEKAIATGALTVQYQDRRVTYRSQKEMMLLLQWMKKQLGLLPSGPQRKRVSTHKDLD